MRTLVLEPEDGDILWVVDADDVLGVQSALWGCTVYMGAGYSVQTRETIAQVSEKLGLILNPTKASVSAGSRG